MHVEDAGPSTSAAAVLTRRLLSSSVWLVLFSGSCLVLAALLCCIEMSHTEKSQIISVEQSDFLKAKQGLGQKACW